MSTVNQTLVKRLNIAAWIVSGAVLFLVGLMRRVKIPLPEGVSFDFLPPFHATMNALTAVVLVLAFVAIRKRNVTLHRNLMMTALLFSLLFLLSYVAYHFTTPETLFGDVNHDGLVDETELAAVGSQRTAYLVFLLTHIVLAAVSFPFILFTFIRAYTGQYERHKRMARWVYPLWLYVAITGPICYFWLQPFYA